MLCLWAINRELEETGEPIAEFCHRDLTDYLKSCEEVENSFYKHLVLEPYTGMFGDANYINTIGSKTMVKPLGETMQMSIKKEKFLQRTSVRPDVKEHEREAGIDEHFMPNDISIGKL